MKNTVISAILIGTALVAGIFAFMPVEQATSVHTTIAGNITDQTRGIYFQTDSDGGDANEVIIPIAAGEAFQATVTVSSAGGACVVEDDDGTALVTGVDGTVVIATIGNVNASTTNTALFIDDDDVRLDTAANTSCYVTFLITEFD